MKTIPQILTLFCLLIVTNTQATLLTNGTFQNCNFNGWDTFTDGSDNPAPNGDFNIINNAGDCQAEINIDFSDGANAFHANTLSTALDLNADADSQLWLSFDWEFSGFDNGTDSADRFFVNFIDDMGNMVDANGNLGFLIAPSTVYNAGNFSVMLDNSLTNQSGWFLDFNLEGGFNSDSFSSTLLIDNVALTAISTDVPAPPITALLLLGAATLLSRRKQTNGTH